LHGCEKNGFYYSFVKKVISEQPLITIIKEGRKEYPFPPSL